MSRYVTRILEVEEDFPISKLSRRLIKGENSLVAFVTLNKGCHVERHSHASEQIAIIRHGLARWTVGAEGTDSYEEFLAKPGDVVVLPPNVPHGVDAEEETEIIDILSPVGPMGVDSQVSSTQASAH